MNCILPGAVNTDIANVWSEATKAHAAQVPLARIGEPDDYVGPALWLASAASGWVTGVILRVDGGAFRQMS